MRNQQCYLHDTCRSNTNMHPCNCVCVIVSSCGLWSICLTRSFRALSDWLFDILNSHLHLLVIGCHSLPCLSCLGRQIEAVMSQNQERDCHCDWIWIWSRWQSGVMMFFLSQACLLHQMLSYLCVCNTLVWLREGSKTFCNLIAVLLTPFHWSPYLCTFSLQPKVFSCCCSQPQSTLSLSVCLLHTLTSVADRGFGLI